MFGKLQTAQQHQRQSACNNRSALFERINTARRVAEVQEILGELVDLSVNLNLKVCAPSRQGQQQRQTLIRKQAERQQKKGEEVEEGESEQNLALRQTAVDDSRQQLPSAASLHHQQTHTHSHIHRLSYLQAAIGTTITIVERTTENPQQ